VITTKPTALLVLFASDFYQIASKIPSLAEAIEIEARRRQAENQERRAARKSPKRRLLTKATPPTSAGQMTGNNECHYAPRWRNHLQRYHRQARLAARGLRLCFVPLADTVAAASK
jgi:hypothetical protein